MKKILLTTIIALLTSLLFTNISRAQVTFPYETNFESSPQFEEDWEVLAIQGYEGYGHVEIGEWDSYSGTNALFFYYKNKTEIQCVMAADLQIDLANQNNDVFVDFAWKACNNINNSSVDCILYSSSQAPNFLNCGVYLSDDGTNFIEVYNLSDLHDWQLNSLNISDLAKENDLKLNSQFVIRFQYEVIYGTQGMALDDLNVYSGCQEHYSFSNTSNLHYYPNSNGVYAVSDYINTGFNVTIQNGTSVVFNVAKSANMTTGFHAEAGSSFHAYLEGCASSKDYTGELNTKNNKEENISEFVIYPNPTSGIINMYFSSPDDIQKLEVKDQFGKILFQSSNIDMNNTYELNEFSKGLYFIFIYTTGGIKVEKVIYQ